MSTTRGSFDPESVPATACSRQRYEEGTFAMAHYELTLPVSEEAVRRLRVNDTVTLQRTLYGIRDATQIAMFDKARATRFDLSGHAVIHTAPNVKRVAPSAAHPTGYAPVCIGTTTSMRMERFTDPVLRLGVRIIVGKGGLGAASLAAFRELGGAYLAIIGGTVLVSLANVVMFQGAENLPEAAKVAIYVRIYELALVIPLLSVSGIVLASVLKRREARRLSASLA